MDGDGGGGGEERGSALLLLLYDHLYDSWMAPVKTDSVLHCTDTNIDWVLIKRRGQLKGLVQTNWDGKH